MELTFSTVHTVQCKVNIYCIALQERICTAHQYHCAMCNVHYTQQDIHKLCQKPVYCATTESHFASLLIKRQENNFSSRNKLNFATSITMIVQKVKSVGRPRENYHSTHEKSISLLKVMLLSLYLKKYSFPGEKYCSFNESMESSAG